MKRDSKNIERHKEFYDEYWADLKPFSRYKIKRVAHILELLIHCRTQLRLDRPVDILDLGCGDGRSVAVWQIVGHACGLDLSEKAMEAAQKMFPKLRFYAGNALESPFEDQAFDVVISQEVIEHIEVQSRYVDECYRVLRKGGYLILTTPNNYYFQRRKGGNYSQQPIENLLTPKELRELLVPQFEVIRHYTIIPATGDHGIYRLLDSRWLKGGMYKIGLGSLHDKMKNKWMLSLNQVVMARKV